MQITRANIDEYLAKYFEGETTGEEEAELIRYFKEVRFLPRRLEPYKSMFLWIDSGMPDVPFVKKHRFPILKWSLIGSLSVAAILAVIFTLKLPSNTPVSPLSPTDEMYLGSYVQVNGVRNSDIASIMPEIRATIEQVKQMEYELNHLNFTNPEFKI